MPRTKQQFPDYNISYNELAATPNVDEQVFTIPLNGQWVPSIDSSLLGTNFKTMTNMRYSDGHPKSILGMTKLNSTALSSYLKVRSAHQFTKELHTENHILVQAWNTGLTASQVLQNTATIPATGDFSATALWTDSNGAGVGRFSNAPGGNVAYCNGIDTCLWGGVEYRCAALLMSDSTLTNAGDTLTNPRDYTDRIINTMTTSNQVVYIGGGIDSYTVLMLHGDGADGSTTITDSSTSSHTVTAVGNAQIDTAYAKSGTGAIKFDGTGDYCTVPDHANWYFGADPFTIDLWWRPSSIASNQPFCGQYADADNRWYFHATNASPTTVYFEFFIRSGGTNKAAYTSHAGYTINIGDWYHIELVRTATNVYIFVNGVANEIDEVTPISTNEVPNLAAVLEVGAHTNHTSVINGHIDEFRISKGVARHIANFSVPVRMYDADPRYMLIGCTRPANGVKIYITDGNLVANTLSVKEFNGLSWSALTVTSDGTAVSGKSLAQTGTITWADTTDTSIPRYFEGYYMYWYLVSIDVGAATVSHVTISSPFNNIIDVWDGYFTPLTGAYLSNLWSELEDVAYKIHELNYVKDDDLTYLDVSWSYSTRQLYLGFTSRQTALYIGVPTNYTNDTASVLTVKYWNGSEFVAVSSTIDGTSDDGKTFRNSGIISWVNIDSESEVTRSIQGSVPMYFYQLSWTATLTGTRITYAAGIPATKKFYGHSFCALASERLLLGCDSYNKKNSILMSAQDTADVFNGDDSYEIQFGGDEALTNATSVYAQYSSNLYNIVLVFKKTETWSLVWNQTSDGVVWSRFRLSPNVGLPAPGTLCTASVAFENTINQTKVVCIWRGSDGVYISNGQAPLKVSKNIDIVFDQSSTTHINDAMASNEVSFMDHARGEYHWLWASNSSTTLDKEYVLDIKIWQWFEVDRGSGKRLQCGTNVNDTNGHQYTYGFIDTGYMERLENGTDFDGTDITSTLEFGQMLPIKDNFLVYTWLHRANLIAVAKNTDSAVTMTHYLDGLSSGTEYSLSLADATHRIANVIKPIHSLPAVFHGIKLTHVADDETYGFEPLYFALIFQPVREHTR